MVNVLKATTTEAAFQNPLKMEPMYCHYLNKHLLAFACFLLISEEKEGFTYSSYTESHLLHNYVHSQQCIFTWQPSNKKSLWSGTAPSRIHQLQGTGGSTLPCIKDVDKGSADVGPDRVYLLTYGGTTQTSSPLCVLQHLLLQVPQKSYNLNSGFF